MTPDRPHLEPLTPVAEASAVMREYFESLVRAGFTEWQACRILGVMVAEQSRQS